MLVCEVIVLKLVHVVTNRRPREKLDEVCQAHKEAAVFSILAVDLLSRLHRPQFRFVAPGACPLFHSVWVPNLH